LSIFLKEHQGLLLLRFLLSYSTLFSPQGAPISKFSLTSRKRFLRHPKQQPNFWLGNNV
jgi:hypothetical protein